MENIKTFKRKLLVVMIIFKCILLNFPLPTMACSSLFLFRQTSNDTSNYWLPPMQSFSKLLERTSFFLFSETIMLYVCMHVCICACMYVYLLLDFHYFLLDLEMFPYYKTPSIYNNILCIGDTTLIFAKWMNDLINNN